MTAFTSDISHKTTITPNNRMQSQLKKLLALNYMDENNTDVAPSADVHSISGWVTDNYNRLTYQEGYDDLKPLVGDDYLFVAALDALPKEDIEFINGIISDKMIDMLPSIVTAYSRIKMWEVPTNYDVNINSLSHDDQMIFVKLTKLIEAKVKSMNVNFEWDAIDILIKAILDGSYKVKNDITLFGFDDIPPKVQRLLNSIKSSGVDINEAFYDQNNELEQYVYVSDDQNTYTREVAKIAYNIYKENPNQKIAIVNPSLHQGHSVVDITCALSEVFEPQYALPQTPAYVRPFNVTLGESLVECPIIMCAVDILRITNRGIPLSKIRDFLESPYISGEDIESRKRQIVFNNIEATGMSELNLKEFIRNSNTAPLLNGQLRKLEALIKQAPVKTVMSNWVSFINKCLLVTGWSKGQNINSAEYQAYTKFCKVLDELKMHDALFGDITYEVALVRFETYLRKTVFKTEVDTETPIHVMGVLEAGGMQFDTVILMNTTSYEWPYPVEPTTLIPTDIQQKYNMPHSSIEREVLFTTAVTERIKASSSKVIYSYIQDEDTTASYIVQGETVPSKYLQNPLIDYTESETRRIPCVIVEDELSHVPDGTVKGGVSVLENQAACPMKAALKNRLGIRTKIKYGLGLNHMEQGNVLHLIEETFWNKHKTQSALLDMDEDTLSEEIDDCIELALMTFGRTGVVGEGMLNAEKEKIKKTVLATLDLEKERKPFEVEAVEMKGEANLNGLIFNYRIDRKDKIIMESDEVKRVLLDYKKGSVKLSELGQSMLAPQLPIQALFDDDEINGVGYISLKSDEEKFVTMGEDELIPGMRTPDKAIRGNFYSKSFDETKELMLERLEEIAYEFKTGVIDVKPYSPEQCQKCDLQSVCRKNAE